MLNEVLPGSFSDEQLEGFAHTLIRGNIQILTGLMKS